MKKPKNYKKNWKKFKQNWRIAKIKIPKLKLKKMIFRTKLKNKNK